MDCVYDDEKIEALHRLLIDLSSSQNLLKDSVKKKECYERLESIYYSSTHENFRHYYSDIFSTLSLISNDPGLGSLEVLSENMKIIKSGYSPQNKDVNGALIDISREIIKLYDHTNLDISRISYTQQTNSETLSELSKTKLLINDLQNQIADSKNVFQNIAKQSEEHTDKIADELRTREKEMQKEYISILGIFASIVLAFTGGMSFSGSVFDNISKASIYRTIIISLIAGFLVFNLLWILIDFIRTILMTENIKSGKLVWITVNLLLVAGIVLTCFAYRYRFFTAESVMSTLTKFSASVPKTKNL